MYHQGDCVKGRIDYNQGDCDVYRGSLSTTREPMMSIGIVCVSPGRPRRVRGDCDQYRDSLSTTRETVMSIGIGSGPQVCL